MEKHLEDLKEIRSMMERSSRFMSLSGLAGVIIGILAILYMSWVHFGLGYHFWEKNVLTLMEIRGQQLMIGSFILLVLSLLFSMALTVYRTKKKQQKIWTKNVREMMLAIAIPLAVGAAMIYLDAYDYFLDSFFQITLMCYGLGLFAASRYTYSELRYMGGAQIGLGMLGVVFQSYVLLFWVLGFGLLHILYGVQMYRKYER